MQAITIAIGKTGIRFFTQQYLVDQLLTLVKKLSPPDKSIPVANFNNSSTTTQDDYSNIRVQLSSGSLSGFSPDFGDVKQGAGGVFSLSFEADRFQVNYQWQESYHLYHCDGIGTKWLCKDSDPSNQWPCSPQVGSLTITVDITFGYDPNKQEWAMAVSKVSAAETNVQPNIPSDSILLIKPHLCTHDNVTEAITAALEAIDFATPINGLIKGIVNSIPGSGNLGSGVVYDFSLGDTTPAFPGNDGIQMGVKGGASYNGTVYSGATPPSLPLPAPLADTDTHHLNMYVSNYEVDALNWAYFKAGALNLIINPVDLPDPSVLNVSNYTTFEPSLNPYAAFVMQAKIVQNTAPVTAFQTAYVYTTEAMCILQKQLPSDVYQRIQKLPSTPFLSQSDLDTFLHSANVPATDFKLIEQAGLTMAMVVSQDMNFTMYIQNGEPTLPYIKFSVQRKDVLTALKLGLANASAPCLSNVNFKPSNSAQCLQYSFANAGNSATFIDSSIAGFNGTLFAEVVWPVVAENNYATLLTCLGQIGTPLPIMEGFQFDFENAVLSVQEGYVSILANVEYKNS